MDFNFSLEQIIPGTGDTITITGTGALIVPVGTTAQRPTAVAGLVRYNTSLNALEFYNTTSAAWQTSGNVETDGLAQLAANGIVARTTTGTYAARTLTAPATGITIANPAGTAGNPTFALANDLAAVEGLAGTGVAVRTAADTWTNRTITGTAARITLTNGDGVAGNPTIDIAATYVGQTTITTLGTITTGTWNGTRVTFANIAQGSARSVLGVTGNATADVASIQGTANQTLVVNAGGTALAFGTLAIAGGGTGQVTQTAAFNALSPVTTKGDLIVRDATNNIRLPVGTNGQALLANSAVAAGVEWGTAAAGAGGANTQIQYNSSGTLAGDADFTWDATNNVLTLGGTDTGIIINGITNEPSAPSAGQLRLYSRAIPLGGRMFVKVVGPSGLDTSLQSALFQNRVLMFVPQTGGTGTGSGAGLGPVWTSGGTVNHPTPASTAPAISNQMRRTRYVNVGTTTNQTLGIKAAAADTLNYWRGNAAGLGGFFYAARFIVELYPASTVRIFAGLTASSGTYVVASDTVLNNTCGLWHDTTDPSSGANSFNFVTRDGTTTTKQSIALTNAIVAGNAYDFYMFCPPNGTTLYWRLDDIVNGVTYQGNTSTTLPVNTTFMGPQCSMSNGTANVTVTTVGIGVAGVYTEADR